MSDLSNIIRILPPMKSGNELLSALEVLPEYDDAICDADAPVRLMALSDLYRVYVPSQMSLEIYSKLYLALLRSLQKKGTKLAVQQQNQNFKAIMQQEYSGIMGGSDSFTIIGASGIGKSSAISRAITLITENRIIEVENPYTKIIPCICVQCPFDSSVKGLLLEVLRKVDEAINSNYYQNALRARATTDMLIGSVSQVALNHIGLLVVDEIQNVCNSKNGKSLVGMLTQLINNSGISICMVGTPESAVFFEQAMQLARRSLGLRYDVMEYGDNFKMFCEVLYAYQYVKRRTEITDAVMEWLYEHTSGNISVVVSLIHDAQEIAILNGRGGRDLALNKYFDLLGYPTCLKQINSYYKKTIGAGDWFSMAAAQRIVKAQRYNVQKRERLLDVLREVSQCRSLVSAKAKHQGSDLAAFKRTLKDLADIGINPVTIPREWGVKHIPNLLHTYNDLSNNT